MDKIDYEKASKLAEILRNLQVGGQAIDVGKAGTIFQGRVGYNFPIGENQNLAVGAAGTGFADNRFGIPTKVTGVDLTYGTPNQSITAGYYPNKTQFMGQPMGAGGVSLMYNRSFD
jgi:hypothetical protein